MSTPSYTSTILRALEQSNAIESVYDADSLLQAWYAWEYVIENYPTLSTSLVLRAHKILMLHQPLYPHEKGYFRACEVQVGGHQGTPAGHVASAMGNWVETYKSAIKREAIIQAHIDFEHIHPFVDGNGRTGRLLMNWQLVKAGHEPMVVEEKAKQEYYQWFRR